MFGRAAAAAADGVKPFKNDGDGDGDGDGKTGVWIGPKHVCCCVVEIHGPLQLLFFFLAILALVLLIVQYVRFGFEVVRTIMGVLFIGVCIYLIWLGKAIYILKAFRKEVDKFRSLNKRLKGEVENLAQQNANYDMKNQEHEKLNQDLSGRVEDLAHVEKQLSVLSSECNGSVQQARQLIERLERNIKLDTVNSVFLFFDRADRDRNGKVDGNEVGLFVDNLGFLWKHLPSFDGAQMKASIMESGGLSLDQVHKLVEIMMLDGETSEPEAMAKKLEKVFMKEDASKQDLEASAATTYPGNPLA